MADDSRLENILECEYNWDNGCIEVKYIDGEMLQIKCDEIEEALETTTYSLAKVRQLKFDEPVEYVRMVLSGVMQDYCDSLNGMFCDMYEPLVQSYMKRGDSREMASSLAMEFFMYDS